jgi:tripartite-type tricarboxylate transporter receptor subunit TctC
MVCSPNRCTTLFRADIPMVDEAGLPGFYVSQWHGLWVPKRTVRQNRQCPLAPVVVNAQPADVWNLER